MGKICERLRLSESGWIWRFATALHFATAVACCQPVTFTEDFSSNPGNRGWKVFGDPSLIVWQQGQNLSVTWDSSRLNTYFYLPLGTVLDRYDDFSLALDFKLTDVTAGVNPAKPSTFELAFGFLNQADGMKTNFFRGNGAYSPNLVEFDYFPDTGFSPTIWPSVWATNSVLNYNSSSDYTIFGLPLGVLMRVRMSYSSSNQTLVTSITTNGTSIGTINSVQLSSAFSDFRVGTFAIESYSDAGQDPHYGGSLLAHGTVDNIMLTFPGPPIVNLSGYFTNQQWNAAFTSRTNWVYTLERTADFQFWSNATPTIAGNGTTLILQDTNLLLKNAYYRVRAQRP